MRFLLRFLFCFVWFGCVQKNFFTVLVLFLMAVLLFLYLVFFCLFRFCLLFVYVYIEFILSGIVTITASWSFLWRSFVFIGWVFFLYCGGVKKILRGLKWFLMAVLWLFICFSRVCLGSLV